MHLRHFVAFKRPIVFSKVQFKKKTLYQTKLILGMGLEDRVKIRVEPGLFEFLGWYERGLPSFFNSTDLNVTEDEEINLYNIDKNYRPIISVEKLSRDEKYMDYYNRSFKVTQQITDKHKLTGKRTTRSCFLSRKIPN